MIMWGLFKCGIPKTMGSNAKMGSFWIIWGYPHDLGKLHFLGYIVYTPFSDTSK